MRDFFSQPLSFFYRAVFLLRRGNVKQFQPLEHRAPSQLGRGGGCHSTLAPRSGLRPSVSAQGALTVGLRERRSLPRWGRGGRGSDVGGSDVGGRDDGGE